MKYLIYFLVMLGASIGQHYLVKVSQSKSQLQSVCSSDPTVTSCSIDENTGEVIKPFTSSPPPISCPNQPPICPGGLLPPTATASDIANAIAANPTPPSCRFQQYPRCGLKENNSCNHPCTP